MSEEEMNQLPEEEQPSAGAKEPELKEGVLVEESERKSTNEIEEVPCEVATKKSEKQEETFSEGPLVPAKLETCTVPFHLVKCFSQYLFTRLFWTEKITKKQFAVVAVIILLVAGIASAVYYHNVRAEKKEKKEDGKLKISMIVQPDRVNLNGGDHDATAFSNDNVTLCVYLTNSGKKTAENVHGKIKVPKDVGITPINDTVDFGDIESEGIVVGNFSFRTSNMSEGIYHLRLKVNSITSGIKKCEPTIKLKVVEVGIMDILRFPPTFLFNETSEPFLSSVDSSLLGYTSFFNWNETDTMEIVVRNGGDRRIKNFSFEMEDPEYENIEVKVSSDYSKEIAAGGNLLVFIHFTLSNTEAGIYDFNPKISYTSEITHMDEYTLSVGIYESNVSVDVEVLSETSTSKDFRVQPSLKFTVPTRDKFTIACSGFNLTEIEIPDDADGITNAIKMIVEESFPAYLESSTLVHNKSNWFTEKLLNAPFGEGKLAQSACLGFLGKNSGEKTGRRMILKILNGAMEESSLSYFASEEGTRIAFASGLYYGKIAFMSTFLNGTFLKNYWEIIVEEGESEIPIQPISRLGEVSIPQGDLQSLTTTLPVSWIEISDEDSVYTEESPEWNNITIDKLPLVIKLDVSQLKLEHNVTGDLRITLFLSSPENNLSYLRVTMTNESIASFGLREIAPGEYSIVAELLGFSSSGDIKGISPTKSLVICNDSGQEVNYDSLDEFFTPIDWEQLNNKTHFVWELTTTKKITETTGERQKIQVVKAALEESDDVNYRITSSAYDSSENLTTLFMEFSLPLTVESITVKTFFQSEGDYIELENVTKDIVIGGNDSATINFSLTGKFGRDFNIMRILSSNNKTRAIDWGIIIGLVSLGLGGAQVIGLTDPPGVDWISITEGPSSADSSNLVVGDRFHVQAKVQARAKKWSLWDIGFNDDRHVEISWEEGTGYSDPDDEAGTLECGQQGTWPLNSEFLAGGVGTKTLTLSAAIYKVGFSYYDYAHTYASISVSVGHPCRLKLEAPTQVTHGNQATVRLVGTGLSDSTVRLSSISISVYADGVYVSTTSFPDASLTNTDTEKEIALSSYTHPDVGSNPHGGKENIDLKFKFTATARVDGVPWYKYEGQFSDSKTVKCYCQTGTRSTITRSTSFSITPSAGATTFIIPPLLVGSIAVLQRRKKKKRGGKETTTEPPLFLLRRYLNKRERRVLGVFVVLALLIVPTAYGLADDALLYGVSYHGKGDAVLVDTENETIWEGYYEISGHGHDFHIDIVFPGYEIFCHDNCYREEGIDIEGHFNSMDMGMNPFLSFCSGNFEDALLSEDLTFDGDFSIRGGAGWNGDGVIYKENDVINGDFSIRDHETDVTEYMGFFHIKEVDGEYKFIMNYKTFCEDGPPEKG